ncbi:CopG family transcriptional regulator [Sediminivirga luteola]|jgi:antitoxin component of RelBE/YafQ-DinJ toxin-antitoxin module|uniref:Uncharacterized protein n=1 Tax=Sediminivirga luteola TaxID=1774748 RepID=A0A8J2U0L8_9MICO|nr:CopG family transcriptional regulator [Sediminivirga luteola]GGA25556.1 hypothetical protein GCM10011333_30660 [Sediminivirga luteola]
MDTAVRLDDDVRKAAERLQQEKHISFSDAVNQLARAGAEQRGETRRFVQRSRSVGFAVDVTRVAETLESLDDEHRA